MITAENRKLRGGVKMTAELWKNRLKPRPGMAPPAKAKAASKPVQKPPARPAGPSAAERALGNLPGFRGLRRQGLPATPAAAAPAGGAPAGAPPAGGEQPPKQ